MFRTVFTALVLSLTLAACAQKTTIMDKEKVDKLQLEIADSIQKFDKRPYYTLQVNKQGCRVLVRVNDLPFWYNFFEDDGETMLLPINKLIPQSGEQRLTIEAYPLSTQQSIGDKAHVSVKVIYAPDRNTPMDEFQVIAEYKLPEALGDLKLPRYDITGVFQAQVPFDFSKELKNAKDLTKVPNIEKMVEDKYKQISRMLELGDAYSLLKAKKNSFIRGWSYNYFSKQEIATIPESESEKYDLTLRGREMARIENYEIIFFHNNRIAVLRARDDKSSLLKVYYWEDEEDEKEEEEKGFSRTFVALYMPEGSNELEVW